MAGHVLASVQEATLSTSSDKSTNQVSWQTAFFGLVPLALNAMTQSSSLDFNLPESSLLFMARSSPFICVADALEVLTALCLYTYQEGSIFKAARLVNWRIARARLGNGVFELEASAVEKHPKTFLILFVVMVGQAVKVLGLQGLPWTKVWAGMYLCSFVVLAIVRALAPKGWRNSPPQIAPLAEVPSCHEKLLGISRIVLWVMAGAVHASVSCWALFCMQDLHGGIFGVPSNLAWEIFGALHLLFALCMSWALVFFLPFGLFFYLKGIDLTYISVREQLAWGMVNDSNRQENQTWIDTHRIFSINLMVASSAYLSFILLSFAGNFGDLSMRISAIISFGSLSLTLCSCLLFLLLTIVSDISKRVRFLSFLKFDDGHYKALLVFPFLNLLVALLYYRFVYDPTGTVKPLWTENLG